MNINDKDIFIMSILNYFMIDKNYKPVIIKGIENEIWLENHKEKYDIIRIVNKNIYNNEQFEFDNLKVKNIISQIKRKTFRLSMKVLSIYLEVGDNFTFNDTNDKDLSYIVSDNLEKFKNTDDFENYGILSHSIKSDSKYLGFMDLAEIALSHEMAGKSSDKAFIDNNYDSFVQEINRIVSVVKEYLGK